MNKDTTTIPSPTTMAVAEEEKEEEGDRQQQNNNSLNNNNHHFFNTTTTNPMNHHNNDDDGDNNDDDTSGVQLCSPLYSDNNNEAQVLRLTKKKREKKKMVQFSTIDIREYDVTIGDNPCCSSGIPISLDWSYIHRGCHDVDLYEKLRPNPSRNRRQLLISNLQRMEWLHEDMGHTLREISQAIKQVDRDRRRRAMTIFFQPYYQCLETIMGITPPLPPPTTTTTTTMTAIKNNDNTNRATVLVSIIFIGVFLYLNTVKDVETTLSLTE